MTGFFSRLFGSKPAPARKLPVPEAELAEFRAWFAAQTRPAVALVPDEGAPVAARGSRIGGPAWLAAGEEWPRDAQGAPLDLIAQLDTEDCRSLGLYPPEGVLQFFIGRGDLFGMNMEDLRKGSFLVRHVVPGENGQLQPPPPMDLPAGEYAEDYSPLGEDYRANGLPLRADPFVDRMDGDHFEAEARARQLRERYDAAPIWAIVEDPEFERRMDHHTGGYPAFTQFDFRYKDTYAGYDHTLLRLTSDTGFMWGDCGEAVFLIRSQDLARGDFSDVVYHWDCS